VDVLGWLPIAVVFVRAQVRARVRAGAADDRGASLVEYALLVALIAVVCILAITFLGNNASKKLSDVGSAVGG
jgi:pilus assembly protein Flp/PilA